MTVQQAEQKLSRRPHSPLFAYLADQYLLQSRIAEAKELLHAGIQRYPNHSTARIILAKCFAEEKDFSTAIHEAERVLSLYPHADSLNNLIVQWNQAREKGYPAPEPQQVVQQDTVSEAVTVPEATTEDKQEPIVEATLEEEVSNLTPSVEVGTTQSVQDERKISEPEPQQVVQQDTVSEALTAPEVSTEDKQEPIVEATLKVNEVSNLTPSVEVGTAQPVQDERQFSEPQRLNEAVEVSLNEEYEFEARGKDANERKSSETVEQSIEQISLPEHQEVEDGMSVETKETETQDVHIQEQTEMVEVPIEQQSAKQEQEVSLDSASADESSTLVSEMDRQSHELQPDLTAKTNEAITEVVANGSDEIGVKNHPHPDIAEQDAEEKRIVSKTLAEIYVQQGQYMEAIITYQLLKRRQPELEIEYDKRIQELFEFLHTT